MNGSDGGAPRSLTSAAVWARVALVAVVVGGLFAAHLAGLLDPLSEPKKLGAVLAASGPSGYAAFVVAYALLQPFGVPGTVFIMAAPLIWPWPIAFALSMVGTMAASVVGFAFARFVARDFVSARIPPRFRRYEEALARRAFRTVFTLRLVFWMPPLLHAFFGVSRVPFWTHFWASLMGYVLPLLLVSYFGQGLFDLLSAAPLRVWLASAALFVVVVGIAFWVRQKSSRMRRESA